MTWDFLEHGTTASQQPRGWLLLDEALSRDTFQSQKKMAALQSNPMDTFQLLKKNHTI